MIVAGVIFLCSILLCVRLSYLMVKRSQYYQKLALDLHQRERSIKAERGEIYDRNGILIAANKPVCTVSVIHSQIKDPNKVVKVLACELNLKEEEVRKKVEKVSSREKIKSNVEKEIGDKLREYDLAGVMIDEDYKRYYPYNELASKVIGFTGADNQGIVGLEVKYDKYLQGKPGSILTLTDARGVEIKNASEDRVEPQKGCSLYLSLDVNIQTYAQHAARKIYQTKEAKSVSMIIMNPQNGEIYAMVNWPEFDLNQPYTLINETNQVYSSKKKQELLNKMWRNKCINDTYEPGSTFKMVTATAALEEGVVTKKDTFSCPGFRIVEDRRIRCHKTTGHGGETFEQGFMNSCNPVFMDVGARVGKEKMYENYKKLGVFKKTGIDLPGEANSIMHKLENIKAVELATMSFGQSIQITPIQLISAACTIVNGGKTITPHFGVKVVNEQTKEITTLTYEEKEHAIKKETSDQMKELLEAVVAKGGGSKAQIEGYRIGGKTATSQKLPRGNGKYISSFIGFAPANNPTVAALVLIDEPTGIYYGGTIAAPVIKEVYENILPYLGLEPEYKAGDEEKEE